MPQTVLDEVRHRSLPLYNRLKALLEDDFEGGKASIGKRGWTVWNEAMEETYLVREKGESPNDRNDRGRSNNSINIVESSLIDHSRIPAIRHLGLYYSTILSSSFAKRSKTSSSSSSKSAPAVETTIVLLTDDADNRRKAIGEGLVAYSVREFVEIQSAEISSQLMDLLAAVSTGKERQRGANLFDEVRSYYLSSRAVELITCLRLASTLHHLCCKLGSKLENSCKVTSIPINTIILRRTFRYMVEINLYYWSAERV